MKSEVFYVTYRDRFYTKDAILASAVLVILGMTVIFIGQYGSLLLQRQ